MKRELSFTLVAALVAVAGCNGGGMTPAAPGTANSALAARSQAFAPAAAVNPQIAELRPFKGPASYADFEWGKAVRERMQFDRPVSIGAMEVMVGVRMRDPRGLLAYAQSASDPRSGNYRHFLTPQQIADRFGASESDYKTVAHYFSHIGMRVGMWPQREVLTVTGTLSQLQRAFGTGFGYFHYGKALVIAPLQTPHFSQALPVTSVLHLTTYNPAHTYFVRGIYSHFAGYPPQMIASGFDYSGAFAEGYNGNGVTLGINGTWAISPADVPALGKKWNAQVAAVADDVASPQPASPANGHTGTGTVDPYPAGLTAPPPVTAPCQIPPFPTPPDYNTCNPEDGEAQLDTESVASLAPGSSVLFYIAYNPSICVDPATGYIVQNKKNGSCPKGAEHYPLMGIQLADDSLQQAIADNKSDTQSLSWGEPENEALASGYISSNPSKPGVGQIEFASFAAEGIAVFVSSGDNGAWECFDPQTGLPLGTACVSYPASDPNVVAVGGVNAPIGENGIVNGQITAWADNTTGGGNGHFENNVGSGGGKSTVFAPNSAQAAALGNAHREVPDIALDADPATGPSVALNSAFAGFQEMGAIGGTSASAPEANAEWGDVLSACAAVASCSTASGAKPYRLGNPVSFIYSLYKSSSYKKTFYDVVYGDNQAVPAPTPTPQPGHTPAPLPTPIGYSAGPGYDMVTGVGVPFGGHLVDAVVKGAQPAP
ncbi:MAG TPA: protease pro-enzyme activation domain-containing protein [Candidatus Acidoferrales bacterium]|nr:protease pro-enzyme activation domain-containing protein [Candidatus Acidoferrales bacterium]